MTAQPGFGPSGTYLHFNTRTDLDLALVWRFQNMGLGDLASIREQAAVQRQARLRALQTEDRVVAEVVQTQEAIQGWR